MMARKDAAKRFPRPPLLEPEEELVDGVPALLARPGAEGPMPDENPELVELGVDVPRSRGVGLNPARIYDVPTVDIEGAVGGTPSTSNEGLGTVETPRIREFVRGESLNPSPTSWSVDEEGTVYLPREASFLLPGGPFRDESRRQIAETLRSLPNVPFTDEPILPRWFTEAIDVPREAGDEPLPSYNAPALARGVLNPGGIPVGDVVISAAAAASPEQGPRIRRIMAEQDQFHPGSAQAGSAISGLATAPLLPAPPAVSASSGLGRVAQAGGYGLAGGGIYSALASELGEGRRAIDERAAVSPEDREATTRQLAEDAGVSPEEMDATLRRRRLSQAASRVVRDTALGAGVGLGLGAVPQAGSEMRRAWVERSARAAEQAQRAADRARMGALGARPRDVMLAERYPGGVSGLANELRDAGATGPVATAEELRPAVEEQLRRSGAQIDDVLARYDDLAHRATRGYEPLSDDLTERVAQISEGRADPEDVDAMLGLIVGHEREYFRPAPTASTVAAARRYRTPTSGTPGSENLVATAGPRRGPAQVAAQSARPVLRRFSAEDVESGVRPMLDELDAGILPEHSGMASRIREVIGNIRRQYPSGMDAEQFATVKRQLQDAINWNTMSNPSMQRAYQETLGSLTEGFDQHLASLEGRGLPPGLADQYRAARLRYGAMSRARDWIAQEESRVAGAPIKITDYLASDGFSHPGRWLLNRQIRARGHSGAAALLEAFSRRYRRDPAALGAAGRTLAAAARRGPTAFAAAYQVLRSRNPEIEQALQDEMSGDQPGGSSAPGSEEELLQLFEQPAGAPQSVDDVLGLFGE